jgi:hypothetical protein
MFRATIDVKRLGSIAYNSDAAPADSSGSSVFFKVQAGYRPERIGTLYSRP